MFILESHEITQGQLEAFESQLKAAGNDLTRAQMRRATVKAALDAGWISDADGIPYRLDDMGAQDLMLCYFEIASIQMHIAQMEIDFLSRLQSERKTADLLQPSSTPPDNVNSGEPSPTPAD